MIASRYKQIPWILSCLLLAPLPASAQSANADNWFQIEATVFTYEDANLALENWSPNSLSIGFPERLRRLNQVSDSLQLADWTVFEPDPMPLLNAITSPTLDSPAPELVGPAPFAPMPVNFRLPDIARSSFLQLPEDLHDFRGTNRALTQSAAHRIVFHGVWRQVLGRRASAVGVAVTGGRVFNDRHEVEGSLRFYLTNSGDRVILESNIWLTQFSTQAPVEDVWKLPALPNSLKPAANDQNTDTSAQAFYVNRIIQLQQNRDLRVREFHYIDHPAMGILVQVTPYTVPPLPLPPLDIPGQSASDQDPGTPL